MSGRCVVYQPRLIRATYRTNIEDAVRQCRQGGLQAFSVCIFTDAIALFDESQISVSVLARRKRASCDTAMPGSRVVC